MKIPSALEEMVAGLISDEQKKREEVEAILSKIHELTEPFFNPDTPVPPEPEEQPAPVLSEAEKLKNFTAFRERMGDPPARAQEVAEEMLGMREGRA